MPWSAPPPELRNFNLDTQNTVVSVLKTSQNPTGRITVNATGDFSSGNLEIGYKNEAKVFTVYTDAVTTVAGGYELTVGANRNVFARATGATPDIDLDIQAAS